MCMVQQNNATFFVRKIVKATYYLVGIGIHRVNANMQENIVNMPFL